MYKPKESSQNEYEFVSIDELIPDEHLLRLIDKYIDFTFLLKKVRPFYRNDNGRPSATHLAKLEKVCCHTLG